MIPTFIIFLREGIEASMIIAILLAYLDRAGQRRYFRDVFVGVAAAFVLILAGGIAAYLFIDQYNGSREQLIFETVTYLIAAAALTYMTFWMHAHAHSMGRELQQRSDAALSRGSRTGMSVIAFTSVGREGLETMVFTLAIVFASRSQSPTNHSSRLLIVGAAVGLAVAMAMAVVIYKLGRRLNLRIFFRVLGVTLMVFAAGLLADAVENMQELGWLPFGGHVLWNSSNVMNENTDIGDLFHSLLGYADHPTVLQAIVWVTYVATAVVLFVMIGKKRRTGGPHRQPRDAQHETEATP